MVGNFLGSLHQKVRDTKEMHDAGVNNELASYVHDFFSDPLKGLLESNAASLKGIKKAVQNLIGRLFSSQKDSNIKAFSIEADAQIIYVLQMILLNQGSLISNFWSFMKNLV